MTEILVALLLVLSLASIGLVALPAWQLRQLRQRLALQDRHLARLYRAAVAVVAAYHHVRHNGNAGDRLALDEAMTNLATVAESARKRDSVE